MLPLSRTISIVILFVGAHAAAWILLDGIVGSDGAARLSFFLLLAAAWLLAWLCVSLLSAMKPADAAAADVPAAAGSVHLRRYGS